MRCAPGGAAAVVCVVIVVVKKVMGYGLWVMVVGYGVRRLQPALQKKCFYRRRFQKYFVSLQSLTNQKHTEI